MTEEMPLWLDAETEEAERNRQRRGRRPVLVFAPDARAAFSWAARKGYGHNEVVYIHHEKNLLGASLDNYDVAQLEGWGEHPEAEKLYAALRRLMAESLHTPRFVEAGRRVRPGAESPVRSTLGARR